MTKEKSSNKNPVCSGPGDCADSTRKAAKCRRGLSSYLKSESGIALVIVLVLSAVALTIITAMIYMITVGTRTSGMQKRYRTALEAGLAASNILSQVIAQEIATETTNSTQGSTSSSIDSYVTNSLGISSYYDRVPTTCIGTSTANFAGQGFNGFAAKIMTPTASAWSGCDSSLSNVSTTYDMKFLLGNYTVYTKIVDAVEGNSSASSAANAGGNKLLTRGVVAAGAGEIPVTSVPYQYTIEVEAENANQNSPERAKLSVLYQY